MCFLGSVRVSRKGSSYVPGRSVVNLMCGSMELRWLLKLVDLIFPDGTMDINIPEASLN